MRGAYGNPNLAFVSGSQYVTVDSSADVSAALPAGTTAVSLYSTVDVWVNFTDRGADTPAAAAAGAEKTKVTSFLIPAGVVIDLPCPEGSDEKPVKVAYVRDSADGTMQIWSRKDA